MDIPNWSLQKYSTGYKVRFLDHGKEVRLKLWQKSEGVPPSKQRVKDARERAPKVIAEHMGKHQLAVAKELGKAVSIQEFVELAKTDPGSSGELHPRSIDSRNHGLEMLLGFLETKGMRAHHPVSSITPGLMLEYIAARQRGGLKQPKGGLSKPMSKSGMRRELACLKRAFNFCITNDLVEGLKQNPIRQNITIHRSAEEARKKTVDKAWSEEVLQKLLDGCDQVFQVDNRGCPEDRPMAPYWMRSVITLLAETGMRPGELEFARWSNVDWKQSLIRVDGKTGYRVVILRPVAVSHLKELQAFQKEQGIRTDFLICTTFGNSFARGTLQQGFSRYVKRLGLEGLTPYGARHRAAKKLAESLPIHKVQAAMGHKDIRTTSQYLGTEVEDIADEVRDLVW